MGSHSEREEGEQGAIKQARRHEHKKRRAIWLGAEKADSTSERKRERESAIAVESDPVEAGINEHLDGRTTDGVGRYQNWTGGWR